MARPRQRPRSPASPPPRRARPASPSTACSPSTPSTPAARFGTRNLPGLRRRWRPWPARACTAWPSTSGGAASSARPAPTTFLASPTSWRRRRGPACACRPSSRSTRAWGGGGEGWRNGARRARRRHHPPTPAPPPSLHSCGGNVGDDAAIPLPAWVAAAAARDPDLFYCDAPRGGALGSRNPEAVSLFADGDPGAGGQGCHPVLRRVHGCL